MAGRLRISVSGIRGEVPEALNVELAARLAAAYSTYLEAGRVVVGRDTRPSGLMLQLAICASLQAAGLDVLDFSIIPTPLLQFYLNTHHQAGGIAISAGHNPLPWNAILLLNERGRYLDQNEGAEVFNIYEANQFQLMPWNKLGRQYPENFNFELYLSKLAEQVEVDKIRQQHFKLVIDSCNGAASAFIQHFGEYFRAEIIPLNNDPSRPFSHPPEPGSSVSAQVEAVVKATKAHLGVLFNSDASRLSLVDDQGRGLNEELTFPLALLSQRGKIKEAVTTIVTSRWSDWAAQQAGVRLVRTRVGQSAVLQMMEAADILLGGEGSGSVAWLPFSPAYDSFLALALVLDLLSLIQTPLSELVAEFPPLVFKKLKFTFSPEKIYRLMGRLEEELAPRQPDLTDGLTVVESRMWFNIRPSSTEFILRVFIEGEEEKEVERVASELEGLITQ